MSEERNGEPDEGSADENAPEKSAREREDDFEPVDGAIRQDADDEFDERDSALESDDPFEEASGETVADVHTDADADAGGAGDLTHTDESGDVQMVDVGRKPDSRRRAVASGELRLRESTVRAVRDDEVEKGDVLATARVGAVQAVKHTWETIPMCHQIPITNVETEFDVREDRIVLTVAVETTGKTGCEMEALEGVTTGLNVVWDMVKAVEKDEAGQYPDTGIQNVRVVSKEKRVAE